MLELVRHQPDWLAALGVALTRPPGVPERRRDEDPWNPEADAPRPRRIADDLAYGAGVWAGMWRERTWGPIVPELSSWPGRSAAAR